MKLIKAIIRPNRLNDVLKALFRADVRGLTVTKVQGHGGEIEPVETYRGTTVKMELLDKVQIDIGVSDDFLDDTVRRSGRPPTPARSATAKSSCCPSRRSTAFAPAKKTRRPSHRSAPPPKPEIPSHRAPLGFGPLRTGLSFC